MYYDIIIILLKGWGKGPELIGFEKELGIFIYIGVEGWNKDNLSSNDWEKKIKGNENLQLLSFFLLSVEKKIKRKEIDYVKRKIRFLIWI